MELTSWLSRGVDPLAELESLCGHRWESHALLQLEAGPLRRAQLAATIRSQCDGRPDDTQIDRTLGRLAAQGLVRSTDVDGHRCYELTPQGRLRVFRLEVLVRIVLRWHDENLRDDQSE